MWFIGLISIIGILVAAYVDRDTEPHIEPRDYYDNDYDTDK